MFLISFRSARTKIFILKFISCPIKIKSALISFFFDSVLALFDMQHQYASTRAYHTSSHPSHLTIRHSINSKIYFFMSKAVGQ